MRRVLVTGAAGLVGGDLLKLLRGDDRYDPLGLVRSKAQLHVQHPNTQDCQYFDVVDLEAGRIPWETIDVVVHCAFARSEDAAVLSASVQFADRLMNDAARRGVGAIINVSSQSVYGAASGQPCTESAEVAPASSYGLAKYATEVIAARVGANHPDTAVTSLRLASLAGRGMWQRLTNRFVQQAVAGKPITVRGGQQVLSYLDTRDAASALLRVAGSESRRWRSIYNLGSRDQYTLLQIAQCVADAAPRYGLHDVQIDVAGESGSSGTVMDSSPFYDDFEWLPRIGIESTVQAHFEEALVTTLHTIQ